MYKSFQRLCLEGRQSFIFLIKIVSWWENFQFLCFDVYCMRDDLNMIGFRWNVFSSSIWDIDSLNLIPLCLWFSTHLNLSKKSPL